MGKTRHLFKKIRDIKGTFHTRMGTIKDRNSEDLTEAEEIKKRWEEYTEELYKKGLMTWITMVVWSLTVNVADNSKYNFYEETECCQPSLLLKYKWSPTYRMSENG